MRSNKKFYFIFLVTVLFMTFGYTSKIYAVDRCDGVYSPGNPFVCKAPNGIEGNCVWWTWHWLRYGKGDRGVISSNSFRGSAKTWATKAASLGYTVSTTPIKDAVGVNETIGDYGHVAVVDQVTSTGVWVWEMNWSMTGLRKKHYANGFFKKFIYPHPQPKLSRINPSLIYKESYDQNLILYGENLDKVTKLELTFPNNYLATLSGSQIVGKNYNQLSFLATFGTSGRYVINAISNKNIESTPQMPFNVYQK